MFTLPELPYAYNALEPVISEAIMRVHHEKHHQTYVDKLNVAVEEASELQGRNLADVLASLDDIPESVRTAVRNNGGGHYNHSLFWQCMAPGTGGQPSGKLGQAITSKYGSYEQFTEQFSSSAKELFGSGWVWLTNDLEIVALPNQDTPMMLGKGEPLFGLDVWEHAYYLDYKNKRDEYIKGWWQLVNWEFIEKRFGQ